MTSLARHRCEPYHIDRLDFFIHYKDILMAPGVLKWTNNLGNIYRRLLYLIKVIVSVIYDILNLLYKFELIQKFASVVHSRCVVAHSHTDYADYVIIRILITLYILFIVTNYISFSIRSIIIRSIIILPLLHVQTYWYFF